MPRQSAVDSEVGEGPSRRQVDRHERREQPHRAPLPPIAEREVKWRPAVYDPDAEDAKDTDTEDDKKYVSRSCTEG